MSTEFTPLDDDDDLLAAEYAMGLLEGTAYADARERLRRDAAFVDAVTAWELRLSTMAETLDPVTPSPAVKTALMAKIAPPPQTPQRSGGWGWLWQAASLFSAAMLAIVLVTNPFGQAPQGPQGPLYTAEIASSVGDFRVIAVVDKTRNEVILTRTAGAAPEGRILQVWAHGPDEPAESVGLWPEGDTIRLAMPANIAAVEGVLTLGVSEEPPGGSLTGSPSGRVFGTVDIPNVGPAL